MIGMNSYSITYAGDFNPSSASQKWILWGAMALPLSVGAVLPRRFEEGEAGDQVAEIVNEVTTADVTATVTSLSFGPRNW